MLKLRVSKLNPKMAHALSNLMDLSPNPPSVSRKRSKKQNERILMKNYAIVVRRQREEVEAEIDRRGKILSVENKFHQNFCF